MVTTKASNEQTILHIISNALVYDEQISYTQYPSSHPLTSLSVDRFATSYVEFPGPRFLYGGRTQALDIGMALYALAILDLCGFGQKPIKGGNLTKLAYIHM